MSLDISGFEGASPDGKSDAERRRQCNDWGTWVIEFEDVQHPSRSPEVRAYLRKLAERNPALPAYFSMWLNRQMFALWIGSISAPEAWSDNGALELTHDSVLSNVAITLRAIVELGRSLGVDAGPIVQSLTVIYPRDMSQQFCMVAAL